MMAVTLGLFAGVIFLLYSIYFIQIIKGSPGEFETDLLKSFAAWMIEKGPAARGQVWRMIGFSAILEIIYFVLVFTVISNPVMQMVTGFFTGVEVIHLSKVSLAFRRFFQGKSMLKEVFNWRIERLSAVFFFTHSLLVIFSLIWG
ncbi:hypothetical protein [Syntrophomonas erecta]